MTIALRTKTQQRPSPARTFPQVLVDIRTLLARCLKRMKINATKGKEAIKKILRPRSIQLRSTKRINIRLGTSVILNTISVSKKVTMLISASKNQTTSIGFNNFYVDDWKPKHWIKTGTLYLDYNNFPKYHGGLTKHRKQSQCNKSRIVKKRGLKVRNTNVVIQKINGTTLETYGIVISTFSLLDKDNRKRFFEKTFLLVNVSPHIVLRISFLIISNSDVNF